MYKVSLIQQNHNFNDTHFFKKQFTTNNVTHYITQNNSITNNEHALNIKQDFSTKHYITNVFRIITVISEIIGLRNRIIEHAIAQITHIIIFITIVMVSLIIIIYMK